MKRSYYLIGALATILVGGCKDDNKPEPVNEEELITTVKLTFTPHDGGNAIVFSSTDLDGDGAQAPVVVNGILKDSTMYHLAVEFLNELESPAEEITAEVQQEGTEHQVFFSLAPTLDLNHSYDDADTEGNPIGLMNIFNTGAASTGDLSVILRHEPNKQASGVAAGDITNAGGVTDAEVEFEVIIEE